MTRLPRGLREYENSLYDPEYSEELLARLLDLPENGFSDAVAEHKRSMDEVRRAEDALRQAKRRAADIAAKVWKSAVNNWTVKELQQATGYDD